MVYKIHRTVFRGQKSNHCAVLLGLKSISKNTLDYWASAACWCSAPLDNDSEVLGDFGHRHAAQPFPAHVFASLDTAFRENRPCKRRFNVINFSCGKCVCVFFFFFDAVPYSIVQLKTRKQI